MPERTIEDVIDRLLAVVPVEEHELRARLERIRRDSRYLAPEVMHVGWRNISELFRARLGEVPPTEGWGARAVAILRGEAG